VDCRSKREWRHSLFQTGLAEEKDFECPYGITPETAFATQAEALAMSSPYVQPPTPVRPCCGAKAAQKEGLDAIHPDFVHPLLTSTMET
jgi:hypothetical protein